MIFLKMLKFINGYDCIGVSNDNGMSETAINLLMAHGFKYWDLKRRKSGDLLFFTERKDSKNIQTLLDKNGCEVYIIYRGGLPQIIERYRYRPGLIFGMVLFIVLIELSTHFIWRIEVTGNETVPTEKIVSKLSDMGCRVGAYIPSVDFFNLCNRYLADSDDICWISVNIHGTSARVEVLESSKKSEYRQKTSVSNMIAARDGRIEYLTAYSGNPMVSDGESVLKGQLLISGVTEDKNDGETRYTRAGGSVIAHTVRTITVDIPLEYTERVYTGEVKTDRCFSVFGFRFFADCGKKDSPIGLYETEQNNKPLSVFGYIYLPVQISETKYHYYEEIDRVRDEETAIKLANAEMASLIEKELKDAEISSRTTSAEFTEDSEGNVHYTVTSFFNCLEDIAVESFITVKE